MAKANRLNKRRIDRIDQPGIYGDGNTLFLKVRDDGEGGRGSAQWVQIINMEGKRTERGLGGYPLSLSKRPGKSRSTTAALCAGAKTRGQTRTRQRWSGSAHLQGCARRRYRHPARSVARPQERSPMASIHARLRLAEARQDAR